MVKLRGHGALCSIPFNLVCNMTTFRKQEDPRALDRSPESWHILKMVYWHVAKEISIKDISIFSSGGHVVQLS